MRDEIKSVIQYGDDYYKDLIGACCDVSDRHKEYIKMANNSLKAWSEVLNQLQEWKNNAENEHEQKIVYAYFSAIDIIKQKLEGVTENE